MFSSILQIFVEHSLYASFCARQWAQSGIQHNVCLCKNYGLVGIEPSTPQCDYCCICMFLYTRMIGLCLTGSLRPYKEKTVNLGSEEALARKGWARGI